MKLPAWKDPRKALWFVVLGTAAVTAALGLSKVGADAPTTATIVFAVILAATIVPRLIGRRNGHGT